MEQDKNGRLSLAATKKALDAWRRDGGGKGRLIPPALWAEATELARREGVSRTARFLGLQSSKLKSLVDSSRALSKDDAVAVAQFVEVGRVEVGARPAVCVQLTELDGRRVQVEIPVGSVGSVDLVGLVQAFWSRQR